tara:strand:+ start:6998 stop:7648 length:651 start_codon:yes stop_codon:yes gene_type:complete
MILNIDFSKKNVFFIVVFGCLIYNLLKYQNYILITLSILVFFAYLYSQNIKTQTKKKIEKKDIKKLIEEFTDVKYVNPSQNFVLLDEKPKVFKYIYIKPIFFDKIHELRFIRKYSAESILQIVVILEKFLKIFYNILSERYPIEGNIDYMKDLHYEMKNLRLVIHKHIPSYSKRIHRFGKKSLRNVVDENFEEILKLMKDKIDIVISLINEKKINL